MGQRGVHTWGTMQNQCSVAFYIIDITVCGLLQAAFLCLPA